MADYLMSNDVDFEGVWAILEGLDDDYPYLVRMRTDLSQVAADQSLPLLFEIRWTYYVEDERNSQMPTIPQQDEMAAFENRVVESLQGARAALLVAVNTFKGSRRWLWYCSDRDKVERCINATLAGDPSYPIYMSIISDPQWAFYRRWLAIHDSK